MLRTEGRPILDHSRVRSVVRWAFYGLMFSLPFEYPDRKIPIELPTLAASVYLLATILDARVCFRTPPKVLWWFGAYLSIYGLLTGFVTHPAPAVEQLFRLIQIALLVWTGYNLMRYERIANTGLLAFAIGCAIISVMRVLEIATTTVYDSWEYYSERTTVLGQNPNNLANNLSLGLIALLGLAASRNRTLPWYRYLLLPAALLVGKTIVDTGSRGGLFALAGGMLVLTLGGKTLWLRVRNLAIVLGAVAFIVVVINHSTMKARLEDAEEGHMTGRELIYPTAWQMFREKPIVGWGPSDNTYELGRRIPHRPEDDTRDFHNLVLSVLTASGVVGAIPLLTCLGICVVGAWKARRSNHGILPLALTAAVLVINSAGDWSASKLDWLVLAYGLASASTVAAQKLRRKRLKVPSPIVMAGPRRLRAGAA